MVTYKRVLESIVRVEYQDCDPFNHLINARYIDYIMAARTEQLLENYGFNTSDLVYKHGIGWVSALTQISYLSPAVWMEQIIIETRLINFSDASLQVEACVWNKERTRMKAVMWARLVHFNIRSQRSHRHSDVLMKFFRGIHFPLEATVSFEERVKSLKQNKTSV
ncbi:MAG: acyl-CoA thioesterase [Flavobacterium sp.]|nr:MAG: acyl-CoA thioesterase [Flavobacterium sp.]